MKKLTTEEFIKKAKLVHGDKYDYSNSVYTGAKNKVSIICNIHGEFKQRSSAHLDGAGCPKCAICENSKKLFKGTENFIKKAKLIHGNKYSYESSVYTGANEKIKITCPVHGEFLQTGSSHLQGNGCPKCGLIKQTQNTKTTTLGFIIKAKAIHGNKYDYSKVLYKNAHTKVKIGCKKHGYFMQEPKHHLSNHGCPICKLSHGEKEVIEILKNSNIDFKQQKTFKKCKDKNLLRFDFYLPEYNIVIEYDGKQHYNSVNCFGGSTELKNIQYRDNIKTNYCYDNDIILCRIRYDENIYSELSEYIELKEIEHG